MIPPFNDHPLIQEYNRIKAYFRRHESAASRARIHRFRSYARAVGMRSQRIAFDITGSLNFGMSEERSDVDLVLYLECGHHGAEECSLDTCSHFRETEQRIRAELDTGDSEAHYDIQVIDCINLASLERALDNREIEASVLLRFAFYRSVCRAVNARLLRPYQERLRQDPELVRLLRPELFAIFDTLTRSSRHQLSLKKYRERLADRGVGIPSEIHERIRGHLQEYETQRISEGG